MPFWLYRAIAVMCCLAGPLAGGGAVLPLALSVAETHSGIDAPAESGTGNLGEVSVLGCHRSDVASVTRSRAVRHCRRANSAARSAFTLVVTDRPLAGQRLSVGLRVPLRC